MEKINRNKSTKNSSKKGTFVSSIETKFSFIIKKRQVSKVGIKEMINKQQTANKEAACDEIIDMLIIQDSTLLFNAVKKKKKDILRKEIERLLSDKRFAGHGLVTVDYVMEYIDESMGGYGIIDELIEDSSISDIKVYASDHIRVKRRGKRESVDITFRNKKDYVRFISMIAIKNEIPLSDLNAIQTFTDKESSDKFILRINISTGLVNSTEAPYLQIRKIPKTKYTFDELVKEHMLHEEIVGYLKQAAVFSSGILFCGKGASGKTTLMNTMLEEIPHDKAALVIQENEELFSNNHPDMMFQHIVTSRGEGRISYSLEDLGRNGLLIDLDYYIIGEIKGAEAAHLMMANYTGHQAWTSVHGQGPAESLYKLADYVKQSTDYSLNDSLNLLSGIKTIIYMKDFHVDEVAEVKKIEKDGYVDIKTIFKYDSNTNVWNDMRRGNYI